MPKQQVALNRFEGGLNSDPNPRDIGDNQFSVLKGFSVDSLGGLKLLGAFANHATIAECADTTMLFNPGYGLFSFSADRSVAGLEQATNYLAATNGDYIHIWDDAGGDTSADAWNNMSDSIVDDSNGFPITGDLNISSTTTDHIWSFYAPDGDLRVSDGNFDNYNHTAKILKYISSKTYGEGDNTSYPTTFAQVNIGGNWINQDASVEQGVPTNHLKMINLGGVAKGVLEGDSTGTDVISSVSGNDVIIVHAGLDHSAKAWFSDDTCDTDHTAGSGSSFGSNPRIVQMDSTTNLSVGMVVQGTGIPTDATIVSIDSATLFTISADTTATNNNQTFKFSKPDDYYNGMTCYFFKSGKASIYGTIFNYNGNSTSGTHSTFSIWCGVDGDVTPATALSGETVADWNFVIGQHDGYLWNSDLNGDARNREVISGDYGITLTFNEGIANSGSWMPTENVRYKFYHTTTFDASSGDLKQQESAPSVFTMYPRKSAAGVEAHAAVDEMFFCASDTALDTDNTVGTAASSLAINFGIIARIRSDNTADGAGSSGGGAGGAGNFTIGDSNYDTTDQNVVDASGTYNFFGGNERVTGGRIYWASSDDGFNSLNLLMDYDLEKGARSVGSGSGASTIGGYAKWKSWEYPVASNPNIIAAFTGEESTWYVPPILETYETINYYRHDAKLDAKWKTAVIANNRVYAANVKRKNKSLFDSLSFTDATCDYNNDPTIAHDSNKKIKVGMRVSGNGIPDGAYVKSVESATAFELSASTTGGNLVNQTLTFYGTGWNLEPKNDPSFQDRILKSPVGKYDIFPDSPGYVIEGFNSDDGDEIIKLEAFADRLLVFKKFKLQIYNIQKGEFLENEVLHNGLDGGHQGQACATDFGIAWMNSKGVYFYDGKQIQSLTDNAIRDLWVSGDGGYSDKFWLSNTSDIPVIAFDSDSKKLFCLKTCKAASNPPTDGSNDETCLVYSFKTKSWTTIADGSSIDNNLAKRFGNYRGQLIMEGDNALGRSQIKSWSDVATVGTASGQQAFTTKDIDFGAPGVRKKIYKVYITYQSGNATTNVQVKYGIDGDSTPTETFKDGDYFTGNELLAANGWQVAELKPTNSIKKAKSFQLAFTCDGAVPAAFEIDDITIIYRTKSIK